MVRLEEKLAIGINNSELLHMLNGVPGNSKQILIPKQVIHDAPHSSMEAIITCRNMGFLQILATGNAYQLTMTEMGEAYIFSNKSSTK